MEAAEAAERVAVDARCCCEGYYATIRFVGEVPPAKGVWLGVEWDDSSRGKHSGDHEGTHYFTCRPGSGSFVRPRKVTLGHTFVEALKKRYVESESGEVGGGEGGKKEEEMFVISRNNLVTPVEMVGADKINKKTSQLGKLGGVSTSLRGMLVSSVGPPGEISSVAPNIQELDLSCNLLLSSWETVAGICSQLHLLSSLNLSENSVLTPPTDPRTLTPAFRRVKELTLNKMQLSWSQVCIVVSMFPELEALHCCENNISDISCEPPVVNLKLLTLEGNQIRSWESILHLSSLPRLETLILNNNEIPEIFSSEEGGRSLGFQRLKSLSVCRNRIQNWSSIIAMNAMPALREIRIKGNPLFEGDSELNSRELVIAHLPRLQGLNGSPVLEKERVVAERYYLSRFGSRWVECLSGTDEMKREFETAHPRYSTLADLHKIPLEVLNPVQLSETSQLKNSLLSVVISCPDHPEARQLSKRLPGYLTVQKLKGLLQRVYRVDTGQQRLSYLDSTRNIEIEMDDDLKPLSFFSLQSGDTVLLRW